LKSWVLAFGNKKKTTLKPKLTIFLFLRESTFWCGHYLKSTETLWKYEKHYINTVKKRILFSFTGLASQMWFINQLYIKLGPVPVFEKKRKEKLFRPACHSSKDVGKVLGFS
jgi:hypothetical protein